MLKPLKTLLYLSTISILINTSQSFAACTPSGTANDDIVSCTGVINSFQYFYGGDDTVTLNNTSAISNNHVYWLDESLGGNPQTDGNDIFISNNSQFFWVFGFNGDDTFTITNSQFNNAYGDTNPGHGLEQRGNDTFIIENSTSYGYILGGNDNDTIKIKDSNVSNVSSGYSNIYEGTDYTPFDGDDTIVLDNVNFTAPLYWDNTAIEGLVGGGKGNDIITFRNGGEAYYAYGGHGDDIIEIFDNSHFNACASSSQNVDRCGIYGDEAYTTEFNTTAIPLLHGNDRILLHNGEYSDILIQGGHGSDLLEIATPVIIENTTLDGGDDRSKNDTFVDQLTFNAWNGQLKGSQLINWETILFDNHSNISFLDSNISTGYENGINQATGNPFALILDNNSILRLNHHFLIDANLHNQAIINLQDDHTPGTILTVNHSYTANNGLLYLDTLLNNASPNNSDRLYVKGNTSGTTELHISNLGGNGGQTPVGDNKGILVVEVGAQSSGIFTLYNGPLIVGDYLYTLHKGSNGNWYLQSKKIDYALSITKKVQEKTVTLVQTGNTLTSVTPNVLHYTFRVTNQGNMPLSSIVLSDILPDNTTKIPHYTGGDINHNNLLDINEVWSYTLSHTLTLKELKGKQSFINHVTVDSNQNATSSASATTTIGLLVIDPTPSPTPTPTPTVTPTPTPIPTPAHSENIEANGATIHWVDYSNNELGYKVYLDNKLIAILGKNITSYQLNNLESNKEYTSKIVPYNGSGEGIKQVIRFKTLLGYGWLAGVYHLLL